MKKLFLFLESIIYVTFLFLDFKNCNLTLSTYLKYLGIFICFVIIMIYPIQKKKKEQKSVVATALFFTLLADYCLLLQNGNDFKLLQYNQWVFRRFAFLKNIWGDASILDCFGVFCFIIVQILYLYLIQSRKQKKNDGSVLRKRVIFCCIKIEVIYVGLGLIFLTIFCQHRLKIDFLFYQVIFYGIHLIGNICFSFAQMKRKKSIGNRCFFIGLCVFLLCDIQVGIWNMSLYFDSFQSKYLLKYIGFSEIAMWLFYLPSQVCIVFSIIGDKEK